MKDSPSNLKRLRSYLDTHPDKRSLVIALFGDPDARKRFGLVIQESFSLTPLRVRHEIRDFLRRSARFYRNDAGGFSVVLR